MQRPRINIHYLAERQSGLLRLVQIWNDVVALIKIPGRFLGWTRSVASSFLVYSTGNWWPPSRKRIYGKDVSIQLLKISIVSFRFLYSNMCMKVLRNIYIYTWRNVKGSCIRQISAPFIYLEYLCWWMCECWIFDVYDF